MKYDFLIIGQGLTGTLVGHGLEELNASFAIIDKVRPYAASTIAAGIIHPVSGRRFVKSWAYDQLVPVFKERYHALSLKLGFQFLFEQDLEIYLSNPKEENDLLVQAERYDYARQLKRITETAEGFKNPYSIYSIPSYKLDIQTLINTSRAHWNHHNKFVDESMDYSLLRLEDGKWHYKDLIADQVVFCEGAFVRNNPWFSYIPLVPNKGQILLLDQDENPIHTIKRGLLFTTFENKLWCGATYEWDFDSPAPDSSGWNFLNQKIEEVMGHPFNRVIHASGIRPTVPDRKPIIAVHPNHPTLWCINGFGTKGASVGPYVIQQFIRLLTGTEKINPFKPERLKESLP